MVGVVKLRPALYESRQHSKTDYHCHELMNICAPVHPYKLNHAEESLESEINT